MKKLFLILLIVFTLSSLVVLHVAAEDVISDAGYMEEKFDNMTHSINPRYPEEETCLFELKYTNAQKAVILRDFLVERLSNLEDYKDELTLVERRFSTDSYTSDVLLVNLSELSEFDMYTNSANKTSTKEVISIAFNEIRTKYPKLFWIGDYCYWVYNQNKVTGIGFQLNCYTKFNIKNGLQPAINKINSLTAEFDGRVQSATELIPDYWSDYEKILFVNDYLCVNYKYDGNHEIYNAYDFFKKGTGVCMAYTLAFMAFMDELGIKCDSVLSEEMNHIWNIVEMNGKWYHIDVTWNDPSFTASNTDTFGQAKHNYLLLSSERIQDSTHNHTGFDVDGYGYEFGTDYDEVNVNLNRSLKSSFVELNGTWYNTGYNTNTRRCGLYAFDSSDISSISDEDFINPLYKMEAWGTVGSFSYLTKYKDIILFNTPTSIYAFDGEEFFEIYTLRTTNTSEKIYGFDVKNDIMRLQIATTPNDLAKNPTVKAFNVVDIIYKDHNGDILSTGFTVENEKIPDLFVPAGISNWYTDEMCTAGNEYHFDTPVTGDLVLYTKLSENKLAIESYNETTKQATMYAPEETEGVLFFASYDKDNVMIDCKFTTCTGAATLTVGTNKRTAPGGFNTDKAEKVKVMFFESLTSLTPLCEPLEH